MSAEEVNSSNEIATKGKDAQELPTKTDTPIKPQVKAQIDLFGNSSQEIKNPDFDNFDGGFRTASPFPNQNGGGNAFFDGATGDNTDQPEFGDFHEAFSKPV